MATSGTTSWSLNAGQVVTRALRLVRAVPAGQSPMGDVMLSGLEVLNAQLKSWQAKGALLSSITEATPITLTGAQAYALDPRALAVLNVRYRSAAGIDTPLFEETRDGYTSIPNKASAGRPSLYWFDRQRVTSTLYLWQVASEGSIAFAYKRVLEDISAIGNDLDISQEYLEAVVYGLAVRLGSELPSVDMASAHMAAIIGRAGELESDMFADSRPTEYRFQPDFR